MDVIERRAAMCRGLEIEFGWAASGSWSPFISQVAFCLLGFALKAEVSSRVTSDLYIRSNIVAYE